MPDGTEITSYLALAKKSCRMMFFVTEFKSNVDVFQYLLHTLLLIYYTQDGPVPSLRPVVQADNVPSSYCVTIMV